MIKGVQIQGYGSQWLRDAGVDSVSDLNAVFKELRSQRGIKGYKSMDAFDAHKRVESWLDRSKLPQASRSPDSALK